MEERMGDYSPSSSMKHRLKHTLCGCFKHNNPHQHQHLHNHLDNESPRPRTLFRSTSGGAGGMMRQLINRIGTPRSGGGSHHHRKSKSTDFGYDPLSYALNFEEDGNACSDEYPLRNFTARLPPSPMLIPQPRTVADNLVEPLASSPKEIRACS